MEISLSENSHLWDHIEDLTWELPSGHQGVVEGRMQVRVGGIAKPHSPGPIRRGTENPSRDV